METLYNCHIHTFTEKDIPDKFLPLRLVRFIARQEGYEWLAFILHNANPFSERDALDRYLSFVKTGRLGSQRLVFEECLKQYPTGTKFIIHPMDMAYMGAGNVPRDYIEQLIELKRMRDAYKDISNDAVIPFVHIDPRRPGHYELFMQAIEQWGFRGVKLYPPIGVFPYDKRLMKIYEYCENKRVPVLAHCTAGNPVYWKGSHKQLIRMLQDCLLRIDYEGKTDKELCSYFTHPLGYKIVMNNFPDLKVCLAHFGRETEWDSIILDMIDKYENLYVDISYSMSDENHWAKLKVLLSTNKRFAERCLFGSDFYMVKIECTEKQFGIKLRAYLGEELFHKIAVINPIKYLD